MTMMTRVPRPMYMVYVLVEGRRGLHICPRGRPANVRGRRGAAASRSQSSSSSSSARASGRMPAAVRSSTVAWSASDRRSILRRCPKPASTRANTARRRASSPPVDGAGGRRGRSPPRLRHEDRAAAPCRRRWRRPTRPAAPTGCRRPWCRAGGQALAHLELHHHEHALDGRRALPAGRARAAWRCCTAGWRPAPTTGAGRGGPASRAAMASASTTTAPAGSTTSRRIGTRCAVQLDRGDVGAALEQRQRERPEPGADLDDVVARAHPRQPRRCVARCWRRPRSSARAHGRGQPVRVQQLADRRRGMGHPTRSLAVGDAVPSPADAGSDACCRRLRGMRRIRVMAVIGVALLAGAMALVPANAEVAAPKKGGGAAPGGPLDRKRMDEATPATCASIPAAWPTSRPHDGSLTPHGHTTGQLSRAQKAPRPAGGQGRRLATGRAPSSPTASRPRAPRSARATRSRPPSPTPAACGR